MWCNQFLPLKDEPSTTGSQDYFYYYPAQSLARSECPSAGVRIEAPCRCGIVSPWDGEWDAFWNFLEPVCISVLCQPNTPLAPSHSRDYQASQRGCSEPLASHDWSFWFLFFSFLFFFFFKANCRNPDLKIPNKCNLLHQASLAKTNPQQRPVCSLASHSFSDASSALFWVGRKKEGRTS